MFGQTRRSRETQSAMTILSQPVNGAFTINGHAAACKAADCHTMIAEVFLSESHRPEALVWRSSLTSGMVGLFSLHRSNRLMANPDST
jgi:hypothetical protein